MKHRLNLKKSNFNIMNIIKSIFIILENLGALTLFFFSSIGKCMIFIYRSFKGIFKLYEYKDVLWGQFIQIGFYSIPIVGMTAFFSGGVLALQSYTGFSRFSAESSIATVVILAITRELGPVLTGLMVSGRVGSSMAAEIGTMRVKEQIDALFVLSVNPIHYLVSPRLIVMIIVMPLLGMVADVIGVLGGYTVSTIMLNFNGDVYLSSSFKYFELYDALLGLFKSFVFGIIISLVSCYFGFFAKGGAKGVGIATTQGVMVSSILILLSNYIITALFF